MNLKMLALVAGSVLFSANAFANSYLLCAQGTSAVNWENRMEEAQNKLNRQIIEKQKLGFTEVSVPTLHSSELVPYVCVLVSTPKVAVAPAPKVGTEPVVAPKK